MHSHPVFGSIIDSEYSEAGNNRHATAPTDSSAAIPIISEISGLCLSCTALLPQDDDQDDQDYKRAAISRREREATMRR